MAGPTVVLGISDTFAEIINYELVRGNVIWRFGVVLIIALAALVAGRIVQFVLNSYASRAAKRKSEGPQALLFKALANPAYVAIFAAGLYFCKLPLVFHDERGIRLAVSGAWTTLARVIGAIAVAYALYRLVDVIEYYLNRLVGKTETTLDDMLVPAVRKALRVTIAIVAVLLISGKIFWTDGQRPLVRGRGGGVARGGLPRGPTAPDVLVRPTRMERVSVHGLGRPATVNSTPAAPSGRDICTARSSIRSTSSFSASGFDESTPTDSINPARETVEFWFGKRKLITWP